MDRKKFFLWEAASRDTIDVKRCYIDVSKDLVAGILLSQIIYWFLPGKNGKPRVTIEKQGRYWLAKKREDWWAECRITPKQFDRAITILETEGIVTTKVFKFGPETVKHISMNWDVFLALLENSVKGSYAQEVTKETSSDKNPEFPKGQIQTYSTNKPKIPNGGNLIEAKTPAQNTLQRSSSPTPPPFSETDAVEVNINLPKPFDTLSSVDVADALKLCQAKGLNLNDQAEAIAFEYSGSTRPIDRPRNLLFKILRTKNGVSQSSLSKLEESRIRQDQIRVEAETRTRAKQEKQRKETEIDQRVRAKFESLNDREKAELESRVKKTIPTWMQSHPHAVESRMLTLLTQEMDCC